jgi:hypothetical protein
VVILFPTFGASLEASPPLFGNRIHWLQGQFSLMSSPPLLLCSFRWLCFGVSSLFGMPAHSCSLQRMLMLWYCWSLPFESHPYFPVTTRSSLPSAFLFSSTNVPYFKLSF